MSRVRHEIRLDLSGLDLAALRTVDEFRKAARKLLPAALEELGQAMGEVAWLRLQAGADKGGIRLGGTDDAMQKFVAEAGRKYRRHAPDEERQALEELIILRLQQAKAKRRSTGGSVTVPLPPPGAPGPPTSRSRGPKS